MLGVDGVTGKLDLGTTNGSFTADDNLYGGSGNDTILGDAGDDTEREQCDRWHLAGPT